MYLISSTVVVDVSFLVSDALVHLFVYYLLSYSDLFPKIYIYSSLLLQLLLIAILSQKKHLGLTTNDKNCSLSNTVNGVYIECVGEHFLYNMYMSV